MPTRARTAQEILLPVKARLIVLSFAIAVALNMLPWEGTGALIRPDFIALLLVYWAINQPRKVGLGLAWILGLVMDVADGVLFGQYALGYVVLTFVALLLHRRIQRFPLWQQALHVLPMLLLFQFILLMIRLFFGASFEGWAYFGGSVLSVVLWFPISVVLQSLQRRKIRPETA